MSTHLPDSFQALQPIAINQISPDTPAPENLFLSGLASAIYPYSTVRDEYAVQIDDLDVSKRFDKGKIRLVFKGKFVGQALDSTIRSMDTIKIALAQATFEKSEDVTAFDSDWVLHWNNGCFLQISGRDPHQLLNETSPIALPINSKVEIAEHDGDNDDDDDDLWAYNLSSPRTPAQSQSEFKTQAQISSPNGRTSSIYFTPPELFRRRPRPSTDDTFSSGAFFDLDPELAGPLRKRSRLSRSSQEYVYQNGGLPPSPAVPGPEHVNSQDIPLASSPAQLNEFKAPEFPVSGAQIWRDENELYRHILRQKSISETNDDSGASQKTQEDNFSVVTQAGSLQESTGEDQQDEHENTLQSAQSDLYREILQQKIQASNSKPLTDNSSIAVDGKITVDEEAKQTSFQSPDHVRHVTLESVPEPAGDDTLATY
ncbi:hypothetical protein V1514DRAFT_274197, partial [Lipomyces japonicus]|uniref:uncharacterized protein n=1 Tax=Lipomyces japonicus TaxID=56871 RepID=UPI0034CF6A07